MKQALIILGKYPHPGKVKTRLAKDLGQAEAAEFYKQLLEKLFKEVNILENVKVFFCYSDINDKELIEDWLKGEISLITPVSSNVEKNLSNAFEKLFEQKFTRVISIASDVPSLGSNLINQAFEAFKTYDIVIGPDTDGGIYLYGTTKHYPEFFQNNIKTEQTIFDLTVKNIKRKKLKVLVLDTLLDIDTIEDFIKWNET